VSAVDEILAQLAQQRAQLTGGGAPAPAADTPEARLAQMQLGQQAQSTAAALEQQGTPDIGSALRAFQQHYMSFTQRHGGDGEPLAGRKGVTLITGGENAGLHDPLSRALSTVARVNATVGNPRQGQVAQEFDLGDGRKAHVYYDSKGRRKVFVFGGRSAGVSTAGTGGVVAP
jgi:hypothetical protein